MKNQKLKKVGNIIGNILLYIFLAICVFAVIMTVFSKKDTDGAAEIFGYQMRIITSDSMAKCELTDVSAYEIKSIPLRSMIFVEVVPDDPAEAQEWYRSLKVGDVLTFRYVYTSQVTITHRITYIAENERGGFTIELAGDNKNSDSGQLIQVIDTSVSESTNYVVGKVTGQLFVLGFIISLLKTPLGIVFIVIVPCFIVILLEVLKIVGAYTAERKKREQEETAKKDSELEELRRRLAALEGTENPAGAATQPAEAATTPAEALPTEATTTPAEALPTEATTTPAEALPTEAADTTDTTDSTSN